MLSYVILLLVNDRLLLAVLDWTEACCDALDDLELIELPLDGCGTKV